MATKKSDTKVTRISAGESAKKQNKPAKVAKAKVPKADAVRKKRSLGPLGSIGRYFKGAWFELRQVHWPTRSATWSLTGAVLLFSLFFVLFITALDAAFKFLFEQILR